jgi:hypothetical protein
MFAGPFDILMADCTEFGRQRIASALQPFQEAYLTVLDCQIGSAFTDA